MSTSHTGSASNISGNAGRSTRLAAFPYRGGKFHLAPKLVKLLPSHRIYVEVFGGAANLLLAKPLSQIEVYNDNNSLLVNLFETIRNSPGEFLERARGILYSRELYEMWRRRILAFRDSQVRIGWPNRVDIAVETFYCLVSSFVGDPTKGWAFQRNGKDGGPNRWLNVEDRVIMLTDRLRHVAIDHLDFRDCIKNWDSEETLLYCDPPYPSSVSKGFYGHTFTWQDHVDLAKILRNVKARWLLTYDDIPQIRELYQEFQIASISSTLASQKVPMAARRVRLKQILITNFDAKVKDND